MLGHGGSSAGSYLADPTSPIPSHCAVTILFQSVAVHQFAVTGTLRDNVGITLCEHLSSFFWHIPVAPRDVIVR